MVYRGNEIAIMRAFVKRITGVDVEPFVGKDKAGPLLDLQGPAQMAILRSAPEEPGQAQGDPGVTDGPQEDR